MMAVTIQNLEFGVSNDALSYTLIYRIILLTFGYVGCRYAF